MYARLTYSWINVDIEKNISDNPWMRETGECTMEILLFSEGSEGMYGIEVS